MLDELHAELTTAQELSELRRNAVEKRRRQLELLKNAEVTLVICFTGHKIQILNFNFKTLFAFAFLCNQTQAGCTKIELHPTSSFLVQPVWG